MNKIFLTLLAAALASAAHAQSESLAASARGFEPQAAEAILPFLPQDAFAGVGECGVLDIKTIRAWSLDEASDMANPCFAAVGRKYSAQMRLQAGFLSAAALGQPSKPGLLLKTDLIAGSKAHRDLIASLTKREGKVLGHPVRVLTRGEVEPSSVSAVQEALHQCIMTTVVRDINNSSDFVNIYGRCLTRNRDLKIEEIRPGSGMEVTLKTAQDAKAVEALNGFVTVNAGKGPVQVMIVAYGASVAMP